MFQNLTGWHALIILAIVLLVFGAAKLPALARSVGQSVRILKTETTEDAAHGKPAESNRSAADASTALAPSTVPVAATVPVATDRITP